MITMVIITNTAATTIGNLTGGLGDTLTIGSGGITTGTGTVQIGQISGTRTTPIALGANQIWNVGTGGLTVTNFISGTSRILTKAGTGILTFNGGSTNSFNGGLNVNEGTVTLNFANMGTPTNLLSAANPLSLGGGALTITGKDSATNTSQTFNAATFNAGRNAINVTKGASATSATLNLGALTINPGSVTVITTGTAWTAGTTPAAEIIRVNSIAGVTLPATAGAANGINVNAGFFYRASTSNGGARWVNVDSTGQLQGLPVSLPQQLTSGTVTGATQNGSVSTTLAGNAQSYGLVTNAGGSPRTLALAGNTYTINGILNIGSQNTTISATTGRLIIGAEKNFVINNDTTTSVTISAPIDNNGSIAGVGGDASNVLVTATNPTGTPGNITFSGVNTYTGSTTISKGTLSLGASNVLPNASAVVLDGGTLLTGNSFTETAKSLSLTAASTITMGGATGTSVLTFTDGVAGTSGISTARVLSVWNWNGSLSGGGNDQLILPVGSLNATELAGINFYSGAGTGLLGGGGALQLGTTGELVPVPEPGALASVFALAGTALFRRRRQA
jgi:fibronectin-binding autotransporter adhesin